MGLISTLFLILSSYGTVLFDVWYIEEKDAQRKGNMMDTLDIVVDTPARGLSVEDILPTRAHPSDAGLDLRANISDVCTLEPGECKAIDTGIRVNIPHGYVGLVHPRSGLSIGEYLTVINAPGTIDAGYTGVVKVGLVNMGRESRGVISPGQKIAQLVIQKVELPAPRMVSSFSHVASERGNGGFGSTGV